jgi:hypothetical protein
VDATKSSEQRKLLEAELEAVGIRLNTKKPDGELSLVIWECRVLNLHGHFSRVPAEGSWRCESGDDERRHFPNVAH